MPTLMLNVNAERHFLDELPQEQSTRKSRAGTTNIVERARRTPDD
jgi:hypothetical protein